MSKGWHNRTVAGTAMNRESSRSHAVFVMTVETKQKDGLFFLESKINQKKT